MTTVRSKETELPENIPFTQPWIGEEEITAVVQCLRSGWLTTGSRVREFEQRFAEYVGCRHAVAVNSCTAALHLALEAIGLQPGEEVLVPTMTFAATAEVVRYLNGTPVLMDCDPWTLNLDVDAVERYLVEECVRTSDGMRSRKSGARVRAIIPVHYAGLPCPMQRIMSIANQYGLQVIEDAAHALPARQQGQWVGTFGIAGAFSFYATKNITTGEGGMLTTNDEDVAQRARMMSLHGISRDAWKRYTAEGSWCYEVLEPGYKYNLTDIAAALGIVQLRRSDELWAIRQRYAQRYTEAFSDWAEIQSPPTEPDGDQHGWHLYPIQLDLARLQIDRGRFIEELKARGIGSSVHFIPLHLHPYYRDRFGWTSDDLPVASRVYPRLVSLPLYPRMTEAEVERVIDTVTDVVRTHRK